MPVDDLGQARGGIDSGNADLSDAGAESQFALVDEAAVEAHLLDEGTVRGERGVQGRRVKMSPEIGVELGEAWRDAVAEIVIGDEIGDDGEIGDRQRVADRAVVEVEIL